MLEWSNFGQLSMMDAELANSDLQGQYYDFEDKMNLDTPSKIYDDDADTQCEIDGRLPTPVSMDSYKLSPPVKKPSKRTRQPPKNSQQLKRPKLENGSFMPRPKLANLFANNPLQQAHEEEDADAPVFTEGRRRDVATKQLRVKGATREELKAMNEACQIFGRRQMQVSPGNLFLHQRMHTPLKPHQLFGTAWLRSREKANVHPRGGILADDMGLGKTIQMLTNIVNGTRDGGEAKQGMTLIVASAAIIDQWVSQMNQHVKDPSKTLGMFCRFSARSLETFIGTNNKSSAAAELFLRKFGTVFATWNEVAQSFPHDGSPVLTGDLDTDVYMEDKYCEDLDKKVGLLHRIKWDRIVLDEAHNMKNHKTKTAKACHALQGTHIWAVSGTPFHNDVDEAYSYFKLLRLPHTENWKQFKSYYLSNERENLNATLEKIMLRRDYKDKIFKRSIADIPRPNYLTLAVTMEKPEAALYHWVKAYYKKKMDALKNDKSLSEDERKKRYLAMLQRIRQMTSHWCLILDVIGSGSIENVALIIKHYCPKLSKQQLKPMLKHILSLANKSEKAATVFQEKLKAEQERVKELRDQWNNIGRKLPKALEKKEIKNDTKAHFSIKEWNQELRFPLLHSAKTRVVVEEIQKRISEDPGRKFLVFTQWREMIRILVRIFTEKGWGCETYHGGMSQRARLKAIDRFKTEPSRSIFVMSMRAGGEGLDLQVASCVINVDLWFNWAKELQAYMRIYRIGQTRQTDIIRIALAGTYDMNLLEMQQRKLIGIDEAMVSGSKHGKGETINDLIDLLEKEPGERVSADAFLNENLYKAVTKGDRRAINEAAKTVPGVEDFDGLVDDEEDEEQDSDDENDDEGDPQADGLAPQIGANLFRELYGNQFQSSGEPLDDPGSKSEESDIDLDDINDGICGNEDEERAIEDGSDREVDDLLEGFESF